MRASNGLAAAFMSRAVVSAISLVVHSKGARCKLIRLPWPLGSKGAVS